MKRSAIALAVLVMVVSVAGATPPTTETAVIDRGEASSRPYGVIWYDDMEDGDNGWTHGDLTATGALPRFHIDSYMAYGGSGHSWWCGSFDYDADGGYGDGWYEYLDIPPTDVSSAGVYAVWTFCFRYDSEPTYDFTHIQAESLGAYRDLDSFGGYGAWADIGDYGYLIDSYDNPFKGRFLFVSDRRWSDADGHNTVGGGFACDNIKLFDVYAGTVFFYDDAETGGLCSAGHPTAAGDYWHRRHDDCSSYSRHYSWWCGDDADTSLIPPFLQNWLDTPWIDLGGAWGELYVRSLVHFEVPMVDADYLTRWVTFDGVTYYQLNASWGDFGMCDGWSNSYFYGKQIDLFDPWPPQRQVQVRHILYTTANGCGPGAAGGAGITIDDTWIESQVIDDTVTRGSWGSIKALYR